MACLVKPLDQNELRNAVFASLAQKVHLADSATEQADEPKSRSRSLRLLLVEDNEVNQAFVVALLTRQGHSVTVARNGLAALEAFDMERFDGVLMDVQMPVMDGYEATAAIREKEKIRRHPHTHHCHDGSQHEGRQGKVSRRRNG